MFAQGTKLLSLWTSQFSRTGGKRKRLSDGLILQVHEMTFESDEDKFDYE